MVSTVALLKMGDDLRGFLRFGYASNPLGPPPPLPRPAAVIRAEIMRENDVTVAQINSSEVIKLAVRSTTRARLLVETLIYQQWSSNVDLTIAIKDAREKDNFTYQCMRHDPEQYPE